MITTIILTALAVLGFGIVLEVATILISVIGVAGYYLIKYALIIVVVVLVIRCIRKLGKTGE